MNPYSTIKSNYDDMEWRPIPNYEQFYEISEYGDVRRVSDCARARKGYIQVGRVDKVGYCLVGLRNGDGKRKNFLRHRLVARVWLGECPKGYQVNHIDQNNQNNHYSNLEYVTCQENIRQSWAKTNRRETSMPHGENHKSAKLTQEQVDEIRNLIASGMEQKQVAKRFGMSRAQICRIYHRTRWHLD